MFKTHFRLFLITYWYQRKAEMSGASGCTSSLGPVTSPSPGASCTAVRPRSWNVTHRVRHISLTAILKGEMGDRKK